VESCWPEGGGNGWSDTWMIAAEAKTRTAAYNGRDYIASREANAQATEYFGGHRPPSGRATSRSTPTTGESFHAGDEEYASQIW